MIAIRYPKSLRASRSVITGLCCLLWLALFQPVSFADEPYARSKDYDLQHSRIALRFDLSEKKVFGDVTHDLTILRPTSEIAFDSVGLSIEAVTVNKDKAKFETGKNKLVIPLAAAAKPGEKFQIEIKYEGRPSKGLYFILPDKDSPNRPIQIWTQGESEDTRYYLPTYDEPNDRLTTETILTVPAKWVTVANGKLVSITDAGKDQKTWTWRESLPSSTYLITVVAGEFDQVKDSWHNVPVDYFAPKGRGDRLRVNYGRTPQMIDLFSRLYGVPYPWEKYDQVMVDDFVAGGMENSSATTNTSESLVDPRLAPEYETGQDDLISHELTHQWFGDLVTCKDWADIWLNEGFATFGEFVWQEHHFGKEVAQYARWQGARQWFAQSNLFPKSIVRHDFAETSDEFDENSYAKGGWVLYMLRHELGDEAFWAGIRHYLETNRGKNVVTADFAKAMEQATHQDIDQFMNQWVFGAGAPKFDLRYAYDEGKHQVALSVKQTQKREGRVGLFRIPVEVEITTSSGPKLYDSTVSKESEVFTFPAQTAPLMVLFDKGGYVLKTAEFHKERAEWLYQLRNAADVADRADAIVALAKLKGDEVATALARAAREDAASGIRMVAAEALGELDTAVAKKHLVELLQKQDSPWVRRTEVIALGHFHDDPALSSKLDELARNDGSYRVRGAALEAIAAAKTSSALTTLTAAVDGESPDDILRKTALRSFAALGNDQATPLVLHWSEPGKPVDVRVAAIYSLGRLDKKNPDVTRQLTSYLAEPRSYLRLATIRALGARGDSSVIPALEALLRSNDLSIEMMPTIKREIARLQNPQAAQNRRGEADSGNMPQEDSEPAAASSGNSAADQRLERLEKMMREMNERLKAIESRLSPKGQ
jgi:aminopeptidase N